MNPYEQSGERVEFYLDNGAHFDYLIYPGKTHTEHIEGMVNKYSVISNTIPEIVYVKPKVMSDLMKESYRRGGPASSGFNVVRFLTLVGPVEIKVLRTMRWSIFVGTMEEYKNNDFNTLFERVLNDEVLQTEPRLANVSR